MAGHKRVAVILAGGEGRRLWPASTPQRPKQFLRLFGNLGVRDLLVAATRSGLLVAEKGRLDGLREALQALEAVVRQAAP